MIKTLIYFHGFASSSESNKANVIKSYLSKKLNKTYIYIPDLNNNFQKAIKETNSFIDECDKPILFMGSSLGGYYASYYADIYKSKAIVINPAIPPLKNFEQYLGENENYSTGEKFIITPQDIKFLRSLEPNKSNNHKNLLVLLESGDVVLNYNDTISYYSGSHIDVCFGGSHSYESIDKKLEKILHFIKI